MEGGGWSLGFNSSYNIYKKRVFRNFLQFFDIKFRKTRNSTVFLCGLNPRLHPPPSTLPKRMYRIDKQYKETIYRYYIMPNFFYIEDKRVDLTQLNKFFETVIVQQQIREKIYRTIPKSVLLRNGKGELFEVSKKFYLSIFDDPDWYETELELSDVEDED